MKKHTVGRPPDCTELDVVSSGCLDPIIVRDSELGEFQPLQNLNGLGLSTAPKVMIYAGAYAETEGARSHNSSC